MLASTVIKNSKITQTPRRSHIFEFNGLLKSAVCTACSSSAKIGLEREDARTPPYPPPPRAQQCTVDCRIVSS